MASLKDIQIVASAGPDVKDVKVPKRIRAFAEKMQRAAPTQAYELKDKDQDLALLHAHFSAKLGRVHEHGVSTDMAFYQYGHSINPQDPTKWTPNKIGIIYEIEDTELNKDYYIAIQFTYEADDGGA